MSHVYNWPLFGLTMEEMFVTDEQFVHQSQLHGQGHVNRVIWWAMQLVKAYGAMDEYGPKVWAAAYIHDLSRRHDGICHEHGLWAIQEQKAKYKELFKKAGVTVKDWPEIDEAVIGHSRPYENPNNRTLVFLKDADAIDRVRLGDLNINMLRLRERSIIFAQQWALQLCESTPRGRGSDVVAAGRAICFRHYRLHEEWQVENGMTPRNDTPGPVLARRRSSKREQMAPKRKLLKLIKETKITGFEIANLFKEVVLPIVPGWEKLHMLTFVRPGMSITKGFWELFDGAGKTWHWKFNDRPQDVRLYNDLRLYGEMGNAICYGVLGNKRWLAAGALERLREMYGADVVVWEDSVVKHSTFTIDDSQTAPHVWMLVDHYRSLNTDWLEIVPISSIYLMHAITNFHQFLKSQGMRQINDETIKKMCEQPMPKDLARALMPKFIELQIHDPNGAAVRRRFDESFTSEDIIDNL